MILFLFISILLMVVICWIAALVSFFFPKHRIWPSPNKKSWRHWIVWPTSTYAKFTLPFLAYFDHGSLGVFQYGTLLSWISLVVLIIGAVFGCMGVFQLSTVQTRGVKGTLRTTGIYRISRNPQYVGVILFLLGLVIFSDSFLTLIVALPYIAWYFFLPFVEEPWMRKKYGDAYDLYYRRTPRFL